MQSDDYLPHMADDKVRTSHQVILVFLWVCKLEQCHWKRLKELTALKNPGGKRVHET